MALKTTEEKLAEVQTAVTAVLKNQEYYVDGIRFRRADLETLYKMEEHYQRKYDREQGTRPRVSCGQFGSAASQ
jgi:hypothetical protein